MPSLNGALDDAWPAGRVFHHQRKREGSNRPGKNEQQPRVCVPEDTTMQVLIHCRSPVSPTSTACLRRCVGDTCVLGAPHPFWAHPPSFPRLTLLRVCHSGPFWRAATARPAPSS
eukprot:3375487-Pyramimonas_sp.AAC.1